MTREITRSTLKQSFSTFLRWAWKHVDPAEYQHGWHIDVMAAYLEAVYDGEIRVLLINIPPGHLKSLMLSVFWPAWVWTKKPEARYVATSYSGDLALRDADRCRQLIRSHRLPGAIRRRL